MIPNYSTNIVITIQITDGGLMSYGLYPMSHEPAKWVLKLINHIYRTLLVFCNIIMCINILLFFTLIGCLRGMSLLLILYYNVLSLINIINNKSVTLI